MASRPNVLLIETDEQTARTLGVYGHPMCQTPTLDRLAAEGAVFDNAYTASPVCVPSRVAMFSGCYAHTTGSHTNNDFSQDDYPNLIEPLRESGYATALI